MNNRTIVYTGPTLSAADVHAELPEAEVRAPVARGDLLEEPWRAGDRAILIDGFFRERRSVGHKEILRLLAAGVDVVGTASMGALRAAELAPCGMRGLGIVYQMYASGEIDGDDEVGVLHGPAARGYPVQTVALVNLRYGAREGVRAGVVPAGAAGRIVAAAKTLPFIFRSWPDVANAVGDRDHDSLRILRQGIEAGEWDVKRRDALDALRTAADPAEAAAQATVRVPFTGMSAGQLLDRASMHEYAPGRRMSDLDVLDAARLFDPDYPAVHERTLTSLLAELAAGQGTDLPTYTRSQLGPVGDPVPTRLACWLTPAELAGSPPAERLRLVMVRVWPLWQSADWRPAVLSALRSTGRWNEWAQIVARADEVAEENRYRMVVPSPTICARMFMRHWRGSGVPPEIEMARRGFTDLGQLGTAVRRFFAYDAQRARTAPAGRAPA